MGGKPSKQLPTEHFLSKPVTHVQCHTGHNTDFSFGHASVQGWRRTNEDGHVAHMWPKPDNGFFAIVDGHSGDAVAKATQKQLISALKSELPPYFVDANEDVDSLERLENTLKDAFLRHDRNMADDVTVRLTYAGSTCVSVFVSASHVTFANLGDSRGIFVRDGRVLFATRDHKPADDDETARIYAAGGTVMNGRIDGALAVSRSFGDYTFKNRSDLPRNRQKVSPEPEITSISRSGGVEYILLACDGVWDVMDARAAVIYVNQQFAKKRSPQYACSKLVTKCLALGSQDNISALIVMLTPFSGTSPFPVQSPQHSHAASRPVSTMMVGGGADPAAVGAIVDAVVNNVLTSVLASFKEK